jgi:AcrR family transcriptional regulator
MGTQVVGGVVLKLFIGKGLSLELDRKSRERLRHREEILCAAEGVFAEKGFLAATVEEVAVRAGFSVGTLYNFFASKEILYHSLLGTRAVQLAEEANAALDKVERAGDFPRAYIDLKIDLTRRYESFFRLFVRERMGDRFAKAPLWQEKLGPLLNELLGRLTAAFAAGMAEGVFRTDLRPEDLTVALDGMSDGFMFEWLAGELDAEGFVGKREAMVKLFLEGVQGRNLKLKMKNEKPQFKIQNGAKGRGDFRGRGRLPGDMKS